MTQITSSSRQPAGLSVDLSDQVVVVAGGGSIGLGMSIGRAASLTYARLGATVCVLDRNLASAQETVDLIVAENNQAKAYGVDMAEAGSISDCFAQVRADHSQIDVLHHNVGIGKTGGFMDTTPEDLDRIHNVNVKSLMLACQQVLPGMVARRKGVITSISSIAGLRYLGYPHLGYCATKASVIHMTRMLAQEYAGQGVRANCVVPGLIDTPRVFANVGHQFSTDQEEVKAARARQVPLGRMGTPWEVAQACAFLACDAASYVTGTELIVDGGLTGKFV